MAKETRSPSAHLRVRPGGDAAVCGQTIGYQEFAFDAQSHAMAHYRKTPFLSVCAWCAGAYDAAAASRGEAVP